jgi:DNA-binding transcriptional ArsR family regulator
MKAQKAAEEARQRAEGKAAGKPKGKPGSGGVKKSGKHPVAAKMDAFNAFIDHHARHLAPVAGLVWLLLLRDAYGNQVKTAVSDIARRLGKSQRLIKYALAELRDRGYAVTDKKGGPAVGPTAYVLSLPEPPDTNEEVSHGEG